MKARGDVIPAIAWLVLCCVALSLLLGDLVFWLFFGGGSSSLGRAALLGAVTVLLWKLYRRRRALSRQAAPDVHPSLGGQPRDAKVHGEVREHHGREAGDQDQG